MARINSRYTSRPINVSDQTAVRSTIKFQIIQYLYDPYNNWYQNKIDYFVSENQRLLNYDFPAFVYKGHLHYKTRVGHPTYIPVVRKNLHASLVEDYEAVHAENINVIEKEQLRVAAYLSRILTATTDMQHLYQLLPKSVHPVLASVQDMPFWESYKTSYMEKPIPIDPNEEICTLINERVIQNLLL